MTDNRSGKTPWRHDTAADPTNFHRDRTGNDLSASWRNDTTREEEEDPGATSPWRRRARRMAPGSDRERKQLLKDSLLRRRHEAAQGARNDGEELESSSSWADIIDAGDAGAERVKLAVDAAADAARQKGFDGTKRREIVAAAAEGARRSLHLAVRARPRSGYISTEKRLFLLFVSRAQSRPNGSAPDVLTEADASLSFTIRKAPGETASDGIELVFNGGFTQLARPDAGVVSTIQTAAGVSVATVRRPGGMVNAGQTFRDHGFESGSVCLVTRDDDGNAKMLGGMFSCCLRSREPGAINAPPTDSPLRAGAVDRSLEETQIVTDTWERPSASPPPLPSPPAPALTGTRQTWPSSACAV